MRGDDQQGGHLFSYRSPEQRVPEDHPLRAIRRMTDAALASMSGRFARMYSTTGRPSIPPEQLLRALLLQVLYSVRSERLLIEPLQYKLLFRWFVALGMDDVAWAPTTFTKNRERLLDGDVASAFFAAILEGARTAGLLSDEHFTIDDTLFHSGQSQKSSAARRRADSASDDPGNTTVDFRGQKRSNITRASPTDPNAKHYGRATVSRRSWAASVTCSWTIDMVTSRAARSRRPPPPRSARRPSA